MFKRNETEYIGTDNFTKSLVRILQVITPYGVESRFRGRKKPSILSPKLVLSKKLYYFPSCGNVFPIANKVAFRYFDFY